MASIIDRGYLYRRFLTVSILSMLGLLVIVGLCWRAVEQLDTNARYTAAFDYMLVSLQRFEIEVARAGLEGDGRADIIEPVTEMYDRLVGVYGALRLSDPAEAGIGEDFKTRLSEAMLDLTRFGDIEAVARRYALAPGAMPGPLNRAWTSAGDDDVSLRDGLGQLLAETGMALTARGRLSEPDIDRLLHTDLPHLRPRVEAMTAILQQENQRHIATLTPSLLAVLAAAALGGLAIWLGIFRPMIRTITLSQAEIASERDRAVQAEQAKGEFLAVMSHELRTPMNAVIGFANLLGQSQLNGLQREFVETIQSSSETLLTLLNDILDFSKIEAGRVELEQVEFSVEELLDGILDMFAPAAYGKGLELSSYIDPTLPAHLVGDPGRLRQVLFNLVGNAVKFTTAGAVSIEMYRDGDCVDLVVTDTGIGIAPDKLEQVFERFTQADTSTSRRYGGTGLGLAISRGLIELMDGTLDATSVSGEGSRFRVRLPLRHTQPPASAVATQAVADIAGRRLLIIDDNAANRRIFTLMLESYGAEPEAVEDAHAAMSTLLAAAREGRPFEAALVDHMMPDVDGYQLATMIRAEAGLADTRLILSSSAHLASGTTGSEAGFDACCPKPVRQSALLACLDGVLRGTAVNLPRQAVPARQQVAHAGQEIAPAPESGGRARLLIAEDNAANRRLLDAILQGKGYAIDMVENGVEAVAQAGRRDYQVMLFDIAMPEMGGMEATQRIRAGGGRNADTPIVAITANAMRGDRETYLAAGMDDYVAKPIDAKLLLDKLDHWAVNGRAAPRRTGT